jgi:transcriptional regulator with XRE-family HTH domain
MVKGSSLLREWRERSRFTQYDAAKVLAVAQASISNWENGSVPRIQEALRIDVATAGAVPVSSWAQELPAPVSP